MRFLGTSIGVPRYVPPVSAWIKHGPFAMWLVRHFKPHVIVELGSHYGYSYFAMCQSVKESGLCTRCYAVDTWLGDEHSGKYGEEVFEIARLENEKYSDFSTLLRKTFFEALDDIDDGTIDLLHVDGRHFYDDVKADFESWIPKLSRRAVVLFHDTEVRNQGFGVWRYWAEIVGELPMINFPYQHGLGVLFWGPEAAQRHESFVSMLSNQQQVEQICTIFEMAGEEVVHRTKAATLQKTLEELPSASNLLETRASKAERDLITATAETQRLLQEIEELRSSSSLQEIRASKAERDLTTATAETQRLLQEIEELRSSSSLLEIRASETESALATTLAELCRERRYPLKGFWNKVAFKVLHVLSKASPPLSSRTVARFQRSADKRNPDRARFLRSAIQPYESLLLNWQRLRSSATSRRNELVQKFKDGPLISVIVPVYNPDPTLLSQMIDSVLAQTYRNLELCIADDSSTDIQVRRVLEKYALLDNRVTIIFRKKNGNISRATNSAIDIANGTFFAFLDHDDLLDPDAILLVVQETARHPSAKIIYTDEDKIDVNGVRYDPHFKPAWNRELLYGENYISHLGVYDAALVRAAGSLRPGFEGAQDYDLLLRCIEQVDDHQIIHIPKVLYSWRASPGSTAATNTAKPYATEAGRRALSEHLERIHGHPVCVQPGPFPFSYVAQWPLHGSPLVSIIIPTRDHLDALQTAVDSIVDKTDYENFEVIIIDNGSVEERTLKWFKEAQLRNPRVKVIRDDQPFNFSALNNAAVAISEGEFVTLLNNDIEVLNAGWLREMVSLAMRPNVGCVGAKLYYPDGRIQHGGVIIGLGGCAGHSHHLYPKDHAGYYGRLVLRQEYLAVTAACLLVRRKIFDEVGGLNDIDLAVAFNDVDFCLKVHAAGYRNIWTPMAQLTHYESLSRGYEDTPEKKARFKHEIDYMVERWGTDDFSDPAYNPNLTLTRFDFSLGLPQWRF